MNIFADYYISFVMIFFKGKSSPKELPSLKVLD